MRLAALAALAAGLAGVALFRVADRQPTGPLNTSDPLYRWRAANYAQKRATAEVLFTELSREGQIGPATQARLDDPKRRDELLDEFIAAVDATADRNNPTYLSPSLPIGHVASRVAITHKLQE